MTVDGVTKIPIVPPSREEQLQAEVNDLHAQLEVVQSQMGLLSPQPIEKHIAILGGVLVGESDGWMWMVGPGNLTQRYRRATAEEVAFGDAVRSRLEVVEAERRSNAS